MNLQALNFQYEKFKSFESKFPGIKIGLEILQNLHLEKESFKYKKEKSNNGKIEYYDFFDKKIFECCYDSFNIKLSFLYKKHYVEKKIRSHNKLFYICRNVLQKIIIENNYKFINNFNVDNILHHFFFEGLGVNSGKASNFSVFYEDLILRSFDNKSYFDISSKSFEKFFNLFMEELKNQKILVRSFNFEDDKIVFSSMYIEDIKNLAFISYDIFNLGISNGSESLETFWGSRKIESNEDCYPNLEELYKSYSSYTEKQKLILNDELVTLVIVQTTEYFNFTKSIANFFIKQM